MKPLNQTYLKQFTTKLAKNTGAKVELDVYNDNKDAMVRFSKDNTMIHIHLEESSSDETKFKYYASVMMEQQYKRNNIQFGFRTKSLNEVAQLCNLLLYTLDRTSGTLELKAVIKASHWGIKLVTVENTKGYRANLYVSDALYMLINMGYAKIHGMNIERKYTDPATYSLRTKFDKYVLDYDKIQKEGSWSKYDIGFQPVLQYPNGEDYMHPSLTWQKGRLF